MEETAQVWSFPDQKVYFELEFDDETDEEYFEFDEDDDGNYSYGKPDEEGLRFLQEQLQRLEAISDDLEERPDDISEYEWENIVLFYEYNVYAISRVIEETIEMNNKDEL